MRGRPLRFLGLTLGGWVAIRVALLWPEEPPLPALIRAFSPPVAAATRSFPAFSPAPEPRLIARAVPNMATTDVPAAMQPEPGRSPPGTVAMQSTVQDRSMDQPASPTQLPPPLPPTPPATPPGWFSGSAWAIVRGGGSTGSVPGAQLGGGQAGARLTYALGRARRVALAARVSTPLEGRGSEAALGVEWRPLDAPVRLIAEQRWSLDGGRGGPTLLAVAGLPPTRVGALSAEAYAQAGAIARDRFDGFVDGAARLTAPITRGRLRLDLGLGSWGGAQPGAARLDIGPTLGVGVPAGRRQLRVTLDWRQRVAGNARPGSGPALSIGSDF